MLRQAKQILSTLQKAGYEAYIVGGYVRGFLLSGSKPDFCLGQNREQDIDICSSASPDQVITLFDRVLKTGYAYGTVSIVMDGMLFEHTSFRRDLDYLPNSRSAIVSYGASFREDAARRDFTINALAMDGDGKIYDFFGGVEDLKRGLIRAIGDPKERFREDALRKLRAVRFAGMLGFQIEAETLGAIQASPGLGGLSAERIKAELDRILQSEHRGYALMLLKEAGLHREILVPWADEARYERAVRRVELLSEGRTEILSEGRTEILYAALMFEFSVQEAEEAMRRLKFSKKQAEAVRGLLGEHRFRRPKLSEPELREWMAELGPERVEDLLCLLEADAMVYGDTATKEGADTAPNGESTLAYLKTLRDKVAELKQKPLLFSKKELAVNGNDLIHHLQLRKEEHPLLGELLDHLLRICIREPEKNTRATLLNEATNYKRGSES